MCRIPPVSTASVYFHRIPCLENLYVRSSQLFIVRIFAVERCRLGDSVRHTQSLQGGSSQLRRHEEESARLPNYYIVDEECVAHRAYANIYSVNEPRSPCCRALPSSTAIDIC